MAAREDFYRKVHPAPADTLLLVEVSDSTLRYDRDVKVPLYARHDIPEVWIVDLQNGEMRFYRSPQGGRYIDQSVTKEPGIAPLAALPGIGIDLAEVLSG